MSLLSSLVSLFLKIWRALPNRLVAILVFVGMMGGLFLLYANIFVVNVGTIQMSVRNAASAEVHITGKWQKPGMYTAISGENVSVCAPECVFAKMPPVFYEWTARAEGFAIATGSFLLEDKQVEQIDIHLRPTIRYTAYPQKREQLRAKARARSLFINNPKNTTYSGAEYLFGTPSGGSLFAFENRFLWVYEKGIQDLFAPLLTGSGRVDIIVSNEVAGLALFETSQKPNWHVLNLKNGAIWSFASERTFSSVALGENNTLLLGTAGGLQEFLMDSLQDGVFFPDTQARVTLGKNMFLTLRHGSLILNAGTSEIAWPSEDNPEDISLGDDTLFVRFGDTWKMVENLQNQTQLLLPH